MCMAWDIYVTAHAAQYACRAAPGIWNWAAGLAPIVSDSERALGYTLLRHDFVE